MAQANLPLDSLEVFRPVGSPAGENLFAPFFEAPADRPFIAAQIGQSLDGRIATLSGESRYISGAAALDHLHRMRAHVDAVIVGAGTIVADDPSLTVRRVRGRNPARVVIDPSARLGNHYKWLDNDGARRIVITAAASKTPSGVELVHLPARDGKIEPDAIVKTLFALGLRRILVEGGSKTLKGFIAAGCLDRLHVMVAPVIIGSGQTGLDLAPEPRLALALRPRTKVYPLGGGEVLFDCDFSTYCKRSNQV